MSGAAVQEQALPEEQNFGQAGQQGDNQVGREAEVARQRALAFGELAMLAMQHPAYRNFAIADLDWIIGPAVLTGNFLIMHVAQEGRPPAPLAAVTWARVSEEVDQRLMENLHRPFRLSPEEYVSGDIHWIAHTFGPPQAVEALLQAAMRKADESAESEEAPTAGPLAGKQLKQRVRDDNERPVLVMMG